MNKRYEIVSRIDVGRSEWDAFVDASDEAWLWHRFDFQDVLQTWPGSVDRCFALRDKANRGEIVALVPLRQVNRSLFRLATLYVLESLGGPACSNAVSPRLKRELLTLVRLHVIAMAQIGRCLEIRFMLSPMAPAFRGESCPRVNPLLEMGCGNEISQTWVIDLRREFAAVQSGYSDLTRRELKKVTHANHVIREASTAEDIEDYFKLHCETYHRTGAQPHPKAYFQQIFEKFVPFGHSRFLFLEKDGKLIAAQNTAVYKGAAWYWTGASLNEKAGGENRVLFDCQMSHAKSKAGCEWYETGEAFPQALGGKRKGLNDFKRSFGGELFPYFKGRLSIGTLGEKLYHFAAELRS